MYRFFAGSKSLCINSKSQNQELISSQLRSANSILASQDRIREGIDATTFSINQVNEGIGGLKSAFEWGISEVVWQIEQNREYLKSILDRIIAPLDTQAKELRKRAEKAYLNGWYDDALEEFLKSEKKNKFDFFVHMNIGMILLPDKNIILFIITTI